MFVTLTDGLTLALVFLFFFFFKPGALQATRALMIVSIIVTLAGLGVACMGMKCTNCGGDDKVRKSRTAMGGGIIILIGGKEQSDLVVFNFYLFIFKRLTE